MLFYTKRRFVKLVPKRRYNALGGDIQNETIYKAWTAEVTLYLSYHTVESKYFINEEQTTCICFLEVITMPEKECNKIQPIKKKKKNRPPHNSCISSLSSNNDKKWFFYVKPIEYHHVIPTSNKAVTWQQEADSNFTNH